MPAFRIVVRGRVQGVGFRHFTLQLARSMGISGEVWNRADGTVEVLAEHESGEELNAFIETLKSGPGGVSEVSVQSITELGYINFTVAPTV